MADDLPFKAEYAKSGRAACKGCKLTIAKESLRIAKMVQSRHFDGKQPSWFHYSCFFKKNNPKQMTEIAGVDALRWDDIEKVKGHFSGSASTSAAKGKDEVDAQLANYQCDYAKSNRSTCKVCENKITKGEIRVAIMMDDDTKFVGAKIPKWHHLNCFVEKKKEEPELSNIAENDISGFKSMKAEDQAEMKKVLGLKKAPKNDKKKTKEEKKPAAEVTEDAKLKEQNDMLWKLRDDLKKNCNQRLLKDFLHMNEVNSKGGESDILDRCVDALAFGAPGQCPECDNSKLCYSASGYKCSGHITAWTKCQYITFKPPREVVSIDYEIKEQSEFLNKFKPTVKERLFPKSMNAFDPEKPLSGKKLLLSTSLKKSKNNLTEKIEELGGTLVTSVVTDMFCFICSEADAKKGTKKTEQLQSKGIPILSEGFLAEVKKGNVDAMIKKFELLPTKAKADVVDGKSAKRKAADPVKSILSPKKAKLTLKGGAVVDPDSGLEDTCHVYEKGGDVYNAVLGLVDLVKGTNSYYKVQVLVHDTAKKYYVFRSWGRVGTTIGGDKLEKFSCLEDATSSFIEVFEEKTGNSWYRRKDFVKHPYKFYPLEIDYGQDDDNLKQMKMEVGQNSKLPIEVQQLVKMIFDVESMKKTMAEFEIDLNKMPLGKLSKRQIDKGYAILGELQKCIDQGKSDTKILDASNRFYTLIPHDFGMKAPPLLNSTDMIKAKMDMLESLMDIEVAYNLLKGSVNTGKDPIDVHYESLKADIKVVDKKTEEYKLVEDYVKNTHGFTHSNYTLEIVDLFSMDRSGEEGRYSPFRELHNRKLLWHGSRKSNFAGIISQGLRIAPPEAPVTGYMFGKGIYFADMVSKSANYCHTSSSNPIGLMLLCEVALGNMYELKGAKAIEKLPKGKHSCKGLGKTCPDPAKDHTLPDGVVVPIGNGVDVPMQNSSLLYNEFIVYDVAQVRMKYLLKLDFKYKW